MQFFIKSSNSGKIRALVGFALLFSMLILNFSCGLIFKKDDPLAEENVPLDEEMMTNAAIQDEIRDLSSLPDSVQGKLTEKDYQFVINELSYEIKRLGAEVTHLSEELSDMKTKADMLENPLKIYNKEIILNNGTSIYGKIIFQDSKTLKVETLIGYLIINRSDIVRIIENFPDKADETGPVVSEKTTEKAAAQKKNTQVPTATAYEDRAVPDPGAQGSIAANCVLQDNIREVTDKSGNRIFSGTVKNIGTRRADFVKVNMVFRTNWSGGTKTLTAFVKGSYHTYASGISSDNTLLPGASGKFSLVIPKSFGTFIGYTYSVDWESYE